MAGTDRTNHGVKDASGDNAAARERLLSDAFRLPHEPRPPAHLPEFKGAYYVKRASSHWSHWSGMETTVTLGTPKLDPKRANAKGEALDGFSTYLGGNANGHREIDAGLSWDYVRNEKGKFDKKEAGWRPFYRNNSWHWANKGDVYWKAGETVTISLNVVSPGKLHMRIADPGADPKRHVEVDFPAPGWAGDRSLQFKRVNAIDQVHNEGHRAKPTASSLIGSEWLRTELLYRNGKEIKRVPMNPNRMATLDTPSGHARIKSSHDERISGGEHIDIYGSKKDISRLEQRH